MKTSISNIAWSEARDEEVYDFLKENAVPGIEIAPTRIFPDKPYDKIREAAEFSRKLHEQYNLEIASMQSIWYGCQQSIFGSEQERGQLLEYSKKAIDFAVATQCGNLVFGSPKNRVIGAGQMDIAYDFFSKLGDYSQQQNLVLAMEPNPVIYGTNFLNTTKEAFEFVKKIDSPGLKINFDLGTFLYNNESLAEIETYLEYIHHVHISEPYLEKIEKRNVHKEIAEILKKTDYPGYVSIETKTTDDLPALKETILYLKEVYA